MIFLIFLLVEIIQVEVIGFMKLLVFEIPLFNYLNFSRCNIMIVNS